MGCREEWTQFAQVEGEAPTLHETRVKQTFSFRKEPHPNTPHFLDRTQIQVCMSAPVLVLENIAPAVCLGKRQTFPNTTNSL